MDRYSRLLDAAYGRFRYSAISPNRTGTLFQRPFGRIAVTSDAYLAWLVVYIHHNPQKHGFVDDYPPAQPPPLDQHIPSRHGDSRDQGKITPLQERSME